ncbi:MAG: hypothetical protein L3J37_00105 [Rhodobacteraceae bacterium]|nr:hypothetical protein [Paracoccaceae bacterium]
MSDFSAYLPFLILIAGLFLFYYFRIKNRQRADKYLDELQKHSELAKENLDLMRRQVAALEEIAKKR